MAVVVLIAAVVAFRLRTAREFGATESVHGPLFAGVDIAAIGMAAMNLVVAVIAFRLRTSRAPWWRFRPYSVFGSGGEGI
ncbi:hypothetical protein ACQP0C_00270 [Nocardia sp. CA-129566]|uniref:hypothetical protein n=1 Tax=Nocardia sp. CA-129566 TaxID=3239976 RepID=UPI003D98D681